MRGRASLRLVGVGAALIALLSFPAAAVTCSCQGAHCSASRDCPAGCICVCADEVCSCTCLDEVKPPMRIKLPPYLVSRPVTARQVLAWLKQTAGIQGVVTDERALDRPVSLPPDDGRGLSVAVVLAEAENQAGFRLMGSGVPLHNVHPEAALDVSFHGLDPERAAAVLTWLAGREVTVTAQDVRDYEAKGVTVETLLTVLGAS